ncbi:hypothetical protein Gotur_019268 [Gossypium turneri]
MDLTNCFIFFLLLTSLYFALTRKTPPKKHPPGSMGFPLIGQTLSFLHAMRTNSIEQWLLQRTSKYGPVSKLSLFGTPTVFVHGQSANKFIFTCDGNVLGNHQPPSFKRICGERNMTALIGDDHKRVRGALVSFLKPEMLKQYVGKMDEEVRNHVEMHWHGNQKVMVMPLMKTLTFNIMSSLIFGIGKGETRNNLIELLQHMMNGLMSLPINLPFTRFNRSLKASAQLRAFIKNLFSERKAALEQRVADTRKDLIACLLGIGKTEPSIRMSDEEIVDNVIGVMIAGYDTSSVLITFLVRLLGMDRSVYDKIVQDFECPPLLGSFRNVLKDFEYEGYTIPKGWQVIWAANMTHMDERIFSDPSTFDPARFEKQASIPPYCFVAFGGGARICPGNEFARIETLVTIHYLVTRFKWKLCCLDNSFSRNPFPVFSDGMLIAIEPKDSVRIH